MPSSTARRIAIDRARSLATSHLDAETLRREALGPLCRALGADGWAWAMSDPASQLAASAVSHHPLEPRMLGMLTTEEDGQQVNRRAAMITARTPAAALSMSTGDHLDRSGRWRSFLADAGIGDELRMVFADRGGCWSYLDLYAARGHRFDQDDVDTAREIVRVLTGVLRRASLAGSGDHADSMVDLPPAVMIVDPAMKVVARTGPANQWLRVLPLNGSMPLPCAVVSAAARVIGSSGRESATVRQQTTSGHWVTVRADKLDTGATAVTMASSRRDEILDFLARACALTPREREVLALLQRGHDTKSLAKTLVISETTAHDHIKHILRKTGQTSRRELLAGT